MYTPRNHPIVEGVSFEPLEPRLMLDAALAAPAVEAVSAAGLGEIHGSLWRDANANGVWDAGEQPLAGWTVYDDADGDGELDSFVTTVESTDVPVTIRTVDENPVTAASELVVSGLAGNLIDVNVKFAATSLRVNYVKAVLIDPLGTRVTLLDREATGTQTFDITLDDDALMDVSDFWIKSTTVRPPESLEALNGQQPNGTWRLEITYDKDSDSGTLDSWMLEITHGERRTVTAEDGGYALNDLQPGLHEIRQVRPDGWLRIVPDMPYYQVDLAPDGSVGDIDFGNYPLPGDIHGVKYNDLNANGVQDTGEAGIAGWTIFLDTNNNAVLDPGELSTLTDPDGNFAFLGLPAGRYNVAEVLPDGWQQTSPAERLFVLMQEYNYHMNPQPIYPDQPIVGVGLFRLTDANSDDGFERIPFLPGVNSPKGSQGLAVGTTSLFFIDGSAEGTQVLYELDLDTGEILDADPIAFAAPIGGLAWVDNLVWLAEAGGNRIWSFDPHTDTQVGSITVDFEIGQALTGIGEPGVLLVASPNDVSLGETHRVMAVSTETGQVLWDTSAVAAEYIAWGMYPTGGLGYSAGYVHSPIQNTSLTNSRIDLGSNVAEMFIYRAGYGEYINGSAAGGDGALRGYGVTVQRQLDPFVEFGSVQISARPGSIDLDAASDTGVSDSDNITRFDGSNPAEPLIFTIDGTVEGATLTLTAKSKYIDVGEYPTIDLGTFAAEAGSTTVQIATVLPVGWYGISVTQTEPGKLGTQGLLGTELMVDTILPKINRFRTGPIGSQRTAILSIRFTFDQEPMPERFTDITGALTLHNDTTGQDIDLSSITYGDGIGKGEIQWDTSSMDLPDGYYTGTLSAAIVQDLAGNFLDGNRDGVSGDDYVFTFHRLTGDITGDAVVDMSDLTVLSGNWGDDWDDPSPYRGDLNLDNRVDLSDLGILAANWGHELPPLAVAGAESAAGVEPASLAVQSQFAQSEPAALPTQAAASATPLTAGLTDVVLPGAQADAAVPDVAEAGEYAQTHTERAAPGAGSAVSSPEPGLVDVLGDLLAMSL